MEKKTQLWWDIPVIETFKVLKEIYLISDEDYRLSIAQNAYNKAIREHTWESRANQILEAVCIIYGLSD